MECERIQDEILEALIAARPPAVQAIVDAHLTTCSTCAVFATRQSRVDAGLRIALAPPRVNARVRAIIRERIRHQTASAWPDLLPDAVHFGSCALVTMVSLVLLPFNASAVLAVATGATIVSHALLTAVQSALDAAGDVG